MKRILIRLTARAAALLLLAGAAGAIGPAGHVSAQTAGSCGVDSARLAPDAEEQAVLDQVNVYRASYGLQPLHFSYALTVNALWKSTDMATQHYFSHDDLDRSWMQRFVDCGYTLDGAFVGENLAAGNSGGAGTLRQWENSPAHKENLLNPNFSAVGIKRVHSTDQYGWYWSMELGSAVDAQITPA